MKKSIYLHKTLVMTNSKAFKSHFCKQWQKQLDEERRRSTFHGRLQFHLLVAIPYR